MRPVWVEEERMLEVFDSDSTHRILNVRRRDFVPSLARESLATRDGERTGRKSLVSLRVIAEPGVHLFETWSDQLVMPDQPAPSECRQ